MRSLIREGHRRLIRKHLTACAEHVLAPFGQVPARHHRLLIGELERIERGELDRLMVFMPPGAAKSTYASVLFPAWWFCRHPRSAVLAASHTTELAETFGRRVRNTIMQHAPLLGYGLASDSAAAGRWATTTGGEYFATGVGGAITGRRGDLVIIDDPLKSREEADSEIIRERVWEWFRADLLTRLKPRGRIVLIQTRWHEDDLAGRLLTEMEAGGEQWRVLNLPAIAGDDDPLGRAPGEALWPEWEDAEALARKRTALGEREWSALYQQNPRPAEGSIFRVALLAAIEALPAGCRLARAWDLAATAQVGTRDPDWTVGVLLARLPDGRFAVADVVRLRGGPDETEAAICATAQRDGPSVTIGLPQDPGQAGKAQVMYYTRQLAGYRVVVSPETGDKATRAAPVAAQCNVGNLLMLRAAWNRTFIDELAGFPAAAKDDQVDALSRAFGLLLAPPGFAFGSF